MSFGTVNSLRTNRATAPKQKESVKGLKRLELTIAEV
jgi:hypothetical protein